MGNASIYPSFNPLGLQRRPSCFIQPTSIQMQSDLRHDEQGPKEQKSLDIYLLELLGRERIQILVEHSI